MQTENNNNNNWINRQRASKWMKNALISGKSTHSQFLALSRRVRPPRAQWWSGRAATNITKLHQSFVGLFYSLFGIMMISSFSILTNLYLTPRAHSHSHTHGPKCDERKMTTRLDSYASCTLFSVFISLMIWWYIIVSLWAVSTRLWRENRIESAFDWLRDDDRSKTRMWRETKIKWTGYGR